MDEQVVSNLPRRHKIATLWRWIFQISTLIGIIFLSALLFNILNSSFGLVAVEYAVDPASLAVNGVSIEALSNGALESIIRERVPARIVRTIERDKPLSELSQGELLDIVVERVLKPEVKNTWSLVDSTFKRQEIIDQVRLEYPQANLVFLSWLTPQFLNLPQNSNALYAGARTAILGSLWTILITILVAFPVGVSAAIYLEEYAGKHWINQIIQTNINNLAGVPSIIYGMLGLAIFVRLLEPLTSGSIFGLVASGATANGRTILSAGLTLALLVLPLIIINAQEAIRAVPNSLRQASFGLGATRWQTVWHHVLPSAIPGILTGTILAISRAIGETAPLVVVGAATYITVDPGNVFSNFTTLPIQIYQWTARPQAEFRNIAAAAIMVLLTLLLTLNATAVVLRNRFSRRM
jgi:phosphate transport system permease protein